MKTLVNLCQFCVARNLDQINAAGEHLTRIDKELLLEWLCDHDGFTVEGLPSITYHLISRQLQTISFHYNEQVNDALLHKLSVSGCQLKSVSIRRCMNVTDRGIKQLLKSQVNLEFLRLKAPANAERSFSDAAISMLKSPCLRVVILKGCDNLTSSGVATLVKNCPNIQHLSLVRCTKIGDEAIQQCANILRHHLEILVISSVYLLTDIALVSLGNGSCPNLRELYLDSCNLLSAYGLRAVSSGCPKLSILDIGYCYRMLQEGNTSKPVTVSAFPESLTELALHGIQLAGDFLTSLVQQLPAITVLRLCGLQSLDDNVLESICHTAGKRLLELDLSACPQISDSGLASIPRHCAVVENISLSCCRNITGTKLGPLFADNNRAASIKVLMINGSKSFSVDVIHLAVTSCHNLELLSIAGVSGVDDTLLVSIAENCPRLRIINLKGCKQITDSGVCELARLCPLEEIVLAGGNTLTDKTVFAIANNCPTTMREIYLSGCNMITKAALNYLTDFCIKRIYVQHRTPSVDPEQLMAKNLDTGEFCRADLLLQNLALPGQPSYEDPDWVF